MRGIGLGTHFQFPALARRREARGAPNLYVWLFLAGLAANILSSQAFRLGFPIGPDRLLFGAALVLFALDPRRTRLSRGPVMVLMVSFCAWVVCSMIWVGTLTDPSTVFAALDRVIMPFVL